jgi:endonuclease III
LRAPANEPRAPRAGRLFQEDLLADPFWMIVACSLVNLTTWDQARPAFEWLRRRYVAPSVLAAARPEDLHDALRPLGLWRRRAISLVRLAQAWVRSPPKTSQDVMKLPGCGKYAADTWAIFMDGQTDLNVTDGKLWWFLDQLREARTAPSSAAGTQ